jgi:polynucleotide 5'-hydroxyl-kinase GRC3/NOL9
LRLWNVHRRVLGVDSQRLELFVHVGFAYRNEFLRLLQIFMLSAFAARKAAQAGRQEPANSERDSSSIPVPSPPSETSPTSRPVSKRKPSSQSHSPRKKKKKVKRAEGRRIRYFEEQDASEQEGDVIVIDSDEQDASVDLNPPLSFEPVSSTDKRRWSPSIPLNDSSDEEADGEPDISDVPAPMPSRSAINSRHRVLSTFQPVVDQNTFFFTSDEALSLGLSSFSGGSAAVLALAPTETICLLGTYSFVVLHGAVSISGVDLPASRTTHHVFAPRSSALPVLECLTGGMAAPHAPGIPKRLQMLLKTEVAIVIILELRTGVEGLGRVCKTFDGVFEPSRWQRNNTESQLRLPGVHMACQPTFSIIP